MTTFHKIWKLHKSIYRHLKKKAKSLEEGLSQEFIQYERNQHKLSSRSFTPSTMKELFNSIEKSHVVFLGDFHSFDQNTRNLERLTKTLLKQEKTFSLGVEFVDRKYQYAINNYLKGIISEFEFLEEIHYYKSWCFPWVNYRPFFQMARENNVPILALNSEGTLNRREVTASQIIRDFFSDNKNSRLLVFFGELHIARNKLPHQVKKHLLPLISQYNDTIIHQNLDEVYWSLKQIDIKKNSPIIQFESNEFVLLSAPPWIKYESMISWYENIANFTDEEEIPRLLMNEGILHFDVNIAENFLFFCQRIYETLDIRTKISQKEFEDFNIYEHQKLNIVLEKISPLPQKKLMTFFERLIAEGDIFRIPESSSYYCSTYSINRITHLAGLHLKYLIQKKKGINDRDLWYKSSKVSKFISIIKEHTLGFLSSKIINPYRKCDLYLDIIHQLSRIENKSSPTATSLNIFKEIIEFKEDLIIKDLIAPHSLFICHEAGKRIGLYMGEIIYENLLTQNKSKELNEFLNYLLEYEQTEKELKEKIRQLIPEKNYLLHQKRYF